MPWYFSYYFFQFNYLRFAQLLGSGKANRRWANATVAPIVNNVNVRSTDILKNSWNKSKICQFFSLGINVNFSFYICLQCQMGKTFTLLKNALDIVSSSFAIDFQNRRPIKLSRFLILNRTNGHRDQSDPHLFPYYIVLIDRFMLTTQQLNCKWIWFDYCYYDVIYQLILV